LRIDSAIKLVYASKSESDNLRRSSTERTRAECDKEDFKEGRWARRAALFKLEGEEIEDVSTTLGYLYQS
jgi:hypothetical protein